MTTTQKSDKSDYENYVIQSNIELRDENKRINDENKEIIVRCDELRRRMTLQKKSKTNLYERINA